MKQRNTASVAERREAGLKVVEEMLTPQGRDFMDTQIERGGFCSEISEIAIENIFAQLWARPGLDRRARSLLTIGILIGLRSRDEMRVHFGIALRNGITIKEIEEMIYHATGYAGFPASNVAREAAIEALTDAGAIGATPTFNPGK